jgi:ABC-2 type transport system ATP-binding protein
VIISSHILHEVDVISDQVILLSNGYVVAEGQIQNVRGEIQEHPTQILVRCTRPRELARKCCRTSTRSKSRSTKTKTVCC